jgi:hypothetical protein
MSESCSAGDGPGPITTPAPSTTPSSLRPTAAGGTTLILLHQRLDAIAAVRPDIASQVAWGWEITLEKLPAAL